MNESARSWLVLMMIPFFIGVIVYFLVPLMMIVGANPKLEDTFNNYKIEVEQNSVRALAFLNSRVITNRLQMYRNILSTIKQLLAQYNMGQVIDLSQIHLNSAYRIANDDPSTLLQFNHSMWYSPNVTLETDMNANQKTVFNAYKGVQPYIKSMFDYGDPIYSPFVNLKTIINYENEQFYFHYPSENRTEFQANDTTVLDSTYFNSKQNLEEGKLNMTVFNQGKLVRICTVIFFKNDNIVNGVNCMDILVDYLIKDLTSFIDTPSIELSVNDYYYVRPMYSFEGLKDPQIVANFSSTNLNKISVPASQFFSLQSSKLNANLFKGDRYYYYNVQRLDQTNTFYTIPIATLNTNGTVEVVLYLVVENNFAKAEFAEQTKSDRIAVIMVVPAVVLLVVSMLATTLVLRSIFRKLDEALKKMEDYCSLIKRSDLELEIPEYLEAEDLSQLFSELSKLNQLSKYADWQYFQVPKPERIVRFLKCLKLFEQLKYDVTGLYENICECYVDIGQIPKALHYMRMSIERSFKDTYGRPEEIHRSYEQKIMNKGRKVDKAKKRKEKILARKILRLCQILFSTHKPGQIEIQDQIVKNSQLVRQITYPDILNYEYIGCIMFILSFEIKNGHFNVLDEQLENLIELIQGYEQINKNNPDCETPPDVMYSYWQLIRGNLCMAQQKFVEAYQHAVMAFKGNHFDPRVHIGAKMIIEKVLEIHKISKNELSKFQFLRQYRPRVKREYIFLIDVSKPGLDTREVSIWKKKARAAAEYILNTHVGEDDRVSITEFCVDIKIVCNLIERRNRQKILQKELMASIKAREQSVVASVLPCFRKSVERVSHLKGEKVFLLFLKDGDEISALDLAAELEELDKYHTIIFLENMALLKDRAPEIYALSYSNFEDMDRILESKVIKEADNISSIF